jgi:hypothetical protein
MGCLRGALAPLLKTISPSPFKERGIKGVRSINNLKAVRLITSLAVLFKKEGCKASAPRKL